MSQAGNNVNNETFAIHTGTWINWQDGWFSGSQATLSARDSQLLSSFLSIFISVVGVQLWQIISYTVHQLRSSDGLADGLHQQVQIILRNANSPWSAARGFLDLGWSWRRHAIRFFSRTVPWALLAITYALAFGLLSIFAASEISKAPGDARLIRGNYCGLYNVTDTNIAETEIWQQGETLNVASAAQYASACYPGNRTTTTTVQCDVLPKPFIDFTQTHADECPFDGICNMNHTSPLILDSGMIDSSLDLGINTPQNQRLQTRVLATCTPLNQTGLVTYVNITNDNSNEFSGMIGDTIITYNFGPVAGTSNYTFYVNRHASLDQVGYTLQTNFAYAHSGSNNGWQPIRTLNRTDADVMFVAISANSMNTLAPCDDPIFSAHIMNSVPLQDDSFTAWIFDKYAATIACTQQYQFCNPNNNECTELLGHFDATQAYLALNINNMQSVVGERIAFALNSASLYNAVGARGSSALQAQSSVNQFLQPALPPNQWEIESAGWFATSLARLQQEIQQFAARTDSANLTMPPGDTLERMGKYQCKNQITRSTQGTVSYSLFGLGMTLCLGTFIILISFLIEPITSLLQRHLFKGDMHKCRDWTLNEKLQLHRMALESRGIGPWYGTSSRVPYTDKGVRFTGWQASDADDGSYERIGMPQVQETINVPVGGPEGKPFISDNPETAYYGVHGPQIHVREH